MMQTLLLALVAALPSAAFARDPILSLPLDCALGEDCFVLNYMDADPGPGAADFTCGPQSYDGHKGTDFALTSFAAMDAGVRVHPAAPGVVTALRDGMEDTGMDGTPEVILRAHECGNGVVIDHGGGWETQYCHLKKGSVLVREGERVTNSTVLGRVGFSGMTQFPHVHLAVRENGRPVDPFNTDGITSCGEDDGPDDDLWDRPLAHVPGGIVSVGMDIAVPAFKAVKDGSAAHDALPAMADALVAWGLAHGGRAGDEMRIVITQPDGSVLIDAPQEVERKQALYFRAAGKRQPAGGWPVGVYRVAIEVLRGGAIIDRAETSVAVE
ncbi:M23 family metallopeptidase [Maritimibacter sp. DP1N21-5]|uniref:M23 family metallopeptidase n=1 Tax=Maritimibacter sp. DP1N21-5 TaxID=2836867 RepID=UPI001C4595DB|nr:M23 family metallopeptidase [Maritimibacter sp. DP1N21-5]MBV7410421.1 M23 family metallopeptidase [Maritimibacter sp. DP1N21-5]